MSNSGVFDVHDIRYLMDYQQWSGVGTLELIETQTSSAFTAMDFTNIKQDIYNVHLITVNDYLGTADGERAAMRYFENGTIESGNNYQYATQQCDTGGFSESKTTSTSSVPIAKNSGTAGNETSSGYSYIYNAGDSTKYTFNTYHSSAISNSGTYNAWFGSGVMTQASTVDGFRLFGGANARATVSLYGIRYS